VLIVCNNPKAGVLKIAENAQISSILLEKQAFFNENDLKNALKSKNVDFIILAGFLWKLPSQLVNDYPRKIINIHPALLPKYGGKGMYGAKVHEAVLIAKEKESGITIHYVDEHYDNGDIIFQAKCPVYETDSPETLAQRVHELEHRYYPEIIEKLAAGLKFEVN
jgi:phosphoribosylglycinamide formyltransferase-1